ncbi:MAG: hypothetical protein ACE5HT_17110 [Gemmatimonadales bacterium]
MPVLARCGGPMGGRRCCGFMVYGPVPQLAHDRLDVPTDRERQEHEKRKAASAGGLVAH